MSERLAKTVNEELQTRVPELVGHAEADTPVGMDDPLLKDCLAMWQKLREEDKLFVLQVAQTLLDDAAESE